MSDKVKVEFGGDGTGFYREAEKIKSSVGNLRNELVGNLKGAIFATFSIEALKHFNDEFKELVENLTITSRQTGASTTDLQVWEKQIGKVGGEMSDLTRIINKLAVARDKALEDPTGKEAKAFEGLGVSRDSLLNTNGPELFKRLQNQISATGTAAGEFGNLIDILGEKAVKNLFIFTDSFSAMEEKLKKQGRLIQSELIERFEQAKKLNKEQSLTDSLLGGSNTKARIATSVQEAGVFLKGLVDRFYAVGALVTDKLGITEGANASINSRIQDRFSKMFESGTQSGLADMGQGGSYGSISAEQYAEMWAKGNERLNARKDLLKRIKELEEKNAEKALTDEERLTKMKGEQLKLQEQIEEKKKQKDKTASLQDLETYLRNQLKVKELEDKVEKERAQKKKEVDSTVKQATEKYQGRYNTTYSMEHDPLVSTGNFLGTARNRLDYVNVQMEQRDLLKQIEENTRRLAEREPNSVPVDDFPFI